MECLGCLQGHIIEVNDPAIGLPQRALRKVTAHRKQLDNLGIPRICCNPGGSSIRLHVESNSNWNHPLKAVALIHLQGFGLADIHAGAQAGIDDAYVLPIKLETTRSLPAPVHDTDVDIGLTGPRLG